MKVFFINRQLWLPQRPAEIFPFFADAANLEKLTPPWLNFRILTPLPIEIKRGTLIDYRVGIRKIPLRWRTEICEWQPPSRFVDRQLRGPYRLWEHEHTFQAKDGGTLVGDHVKYSVLGGWLTDRLLVRRDLEGIFDYRQERMQQIFGGFAQRRQVAKAR